MDMGLYANVDLHSMSLQAARLGATTADTVDTAGAGAPADISTPSLRAPPARAEAWRPCANVLDTNVPRAQV